jgi:two-component system, cell cycle response regulator CpdR
MSQKKSYALVVEDDIGQREMVVVLLEGAGFEVLQSDTAEAAMIILRQAGRDLALMVSDIRLNGDMPGTQLARFARQLFPNLKVIMTSGKEWPVLPEGAIFLRKPWKPLDLVREARLALA